MYLTRTIQIHKHHSSYKELDNLHFLSKNLYKKVIPDFSCETANLGVEDMANPVRMTFKQLNVRRLQTVKL